MVHDLKKSMEDFTIRTYYLLRPFLPRRIQIGLRRWKAGLERRKCYNIWPIDPASAKSPAEWKGWPAGKKFGLILTHDVESARGHDRCLPLARIEESLNFRSSFNFASKRYQVSEMLRKQLNQCGFEVGVHGLYHDGKKFNSRKIFTERSIELNHILRKWDAVGFRAPSMHCNLDWIGELDIEYDLSTFDTDPFEPKSSGVGTIFPYLVDRIDGGERFVEMPYTLPQDHTIFVLFEEKNINIWKTKLDWIASKGGMALLNTHPDYMCFTDSNCSIDEYPVQYYVELLTYIRNKYDGQYFHCLPRELAAFVKKQFELNPTSYHKREA